MYYLLCIGILGELTKLLTYSFGLCFGYHKGSQEGEGMIVHLLVFCFMILGNSDIKPILETIYKQ